MDRVHEFLQGLETTQGDPHAQAALTAEYLLMARPEAERDPLYEALDAAAVLRWFDAELLRKVLQIPDEDSRRRYATLTSFSFVEPFRGKSGLCNIQRSTRLGWRKKIAGEERFRTLSIRASSCFANDPSASGRIEWIYHLLCGNPDLGGSELEKLDREWSGAARPEDRYALAAALQELVDTDLVRGRARAWSLLCIAWIRMENRGEAAQLGEIAAEALRLAEEAQDTSAKAQARCLEGDVLQARGNLPTAHEAFAKFLALLQSAVEQDPGDAGRRRDLAVAYNRVGHALQTLGNLEAAQEAFDQSFEIFQSVAKQDPSNLARQRDLAVAYSRVGRVRQARDQLTDAQAAFDQDLAISQRLAENDPSNAAWQEDLAVTYGRVGGVLKAQGQLEAAQPIFEQAVAIFRSLAEKDPSNAGWRRELAAAYRDLGDILRSQGKLEAALVAFGRCLAMCQSLAGQDPSNVDWQRDLALALVSLAELLQDQGKVEPAQVAFDDSLAIRRRLAEQDPDNAVWLEDLRAVEAKLAALRGAVEPPPGVRS